MLSYHRTVMVLIAPLLLFGSAAPAQEPEKQTQLTAALIEYYIAAQPEVFAIQLKIMMRELSDGPTVRADIDRAAKKHGFEDSAEYSRVLTTLAHVMNHINPQTKALYSSDASKKDPLLHQTNVDLVVKYYDKIRAAFDNRSPK
jgi:hypothetical protein